MRSILLFCPLLLAVSCASEPPVESTPPAPMAPAPEPSPAPSAVPTEDRKPQPEPVLASNASDARAGGREGLASRSKAAPAIPRGARYTISCMDVSGADHVSRSTRLCDELAASSGSSQWYVVHYAESARSVLYHGYYLEIDPNATTDRAARADAERARQDKQRIEAMVDLQGDRRFGGSIFVPLEAPDPDAPPEWNLENAAGFWTLQTAAFSGSPERKRAAVERVRELRDRRIDAWYYHGPSVSSVCVGSFPQEAVSGIGDDGSRSADQASLFRAPTDNENERIIVSTVPLGTDPTVRDVRDRQSSTRVFQTYVKVIDARLQAMLDLFPQHFTNYEPDGMRVIDRATGRQVIKAKPPLLVRVPRPAEAEILGEAAPEPSLITPRSTDELGRRLGTLTPQ
jgi:hypothetical protein